MNKKLLLFGALFAIMCTSLTGCTIQLDDGDIETFEKIKDSANITLNGNTINTEDIFVNGVYNEINNDRFYSWDDTYEESRVQYSYIDLGNSYYIIVYGHDEFGNTTWEYETEKSFYTEFRATEYLGDYNNQVVYLIDNGKLICLDVETGNINWGIEDDVLILDPYYEIRYETGNLYMVYGETLTQFLAVDMNGNVLARKDLASYEQELESIPSANWRVEFEETEIRMIGATEYENYREWLVKINLEDYSVSVKEIEHQAATKQVLNDKTLFYEYGETYYLNSDGTFEYYTNNDWIDKYSTIRESGTWKLENGKLKFHFTEEVIAEGGHYEYDSEGISYLVDWSEKSVPIDNEIVFEEVRYYPDYAGREMIGLNEILFEILEPVG